MKDQLESIRDFYFQFCDIQNLANFFKKKKIVKFLNRKKFQKVPIIFSKRIKKFREKRH